MRSHTVLVWIRLIRKQVSNFFHNFRVLIRAWNIKQETNVSMGDKLRVIAAKIDAIEKYGNKYANPDKVGRMESYRGKRNYNKLKNDIKKELLILLHSY